jgi:hypothetical protein
LVFARLLVWQGSAKSFYTFFYYTYVNVAKLGSKAGNFLSCWTEGEGGEIETHKDREIERQRGREAERQRDRETGRQRDRETERQRDRETRRQRDREAERQRDRETERQRDRETERGCRFLFLC